mmetsp:Transcript_23775/g.36021  ORF Transcript_23775/g.36021 Transcript_23775/m.36021 type:complete len:89 (+) Transcript_23775:955-1221(+)
MIPLRTITINQRLSLFQLQTKPRWSGRAGKVLPKLLKPKRLPEFFYLTKVTLQLQPCMIRKPQNKVSARKRIGKRAKDGLEGKAYRAD